MRVLVCGGRDYSDTAELHKILSALHDWRPFTVLIEGEASGADTLAREWAKMMKIPVEAYHADWDLFGTRAGTIRNSKMLREGNPDFAVVFPGGKGTADMLRKLLEAKVRVMTKTRSSWVSL